MLPSIAAIALIILIIALTRGFVINALPLKRNIDRRFDDLRVRLEPAANAAVDDFLQADPEIRSSNALQISPLEESQAGHFHPALPGHHRTIDFHNMLVL